MDYKKYSLENLENWMHDAISCSEATPQEIYDVIKGVVSENYHIYKNHTERCYELLTLLNGNGKDYIKAKVCDKDDPSPECKGAWNDFWEENYYPEEYKGSTVSSVIPPWGHSDLEYSISNSLLSKDRNSNFPGENTVKDKVVKWQLPVQVDGLTGDCYVNFPDDLLEVANLKEGDQVEWIDQGNGSYLLKKVNNSSLTDKDDLIKFRSYDDMIAEGWSMTADGFWIKEN